MADAIILDGVTDIKQISNKDKVAQIFTAHSENEMNMTYWATGYSAE